MFIMYIILCSNVMIRNNEGKIFVDTALNSEDCVVLIRKRLNSVNTTKAFAFRNNNANVYFVA